jgi:hypothetical protein
MGEKLLILSRENSIRIRQACRPIFFGQWRWDGQSAFFDFAEQFTGFVIFGRNLI